MNRIFTNCKFYEFCIICGNFERLIEQNPFRFDFIDIGNDLKDCEFMSRRNKIRVISYLSACVAVLFIWGAVNAAKLTAAKRELNASKERALTEFGTYMDEISLNLDKSVYVSTAPMMAELSNEVRLATSAAKAALSEITDGKAELSDIYKFLSQTGEYTAALSKKTSSGEKIEGEELEKLYKLKEYAAVISDRINYLIDEKQNGGLDFEQVKTTLSSEDDSNMLYFGSELEDTEQVMDDYPTLIYDGPYSDHLENGSAALLEGVKEVSKAEAQRKAAEFLGVSGDELYFLSECDGSLPCYTFYNTSYTVSLTKKGGITSYVLSSKYAGESKLSNEDAVKIASDYLESKGYRNVRETYYASADGICTVNFAYYEDEITYYTDLIKVSVSLGDGSVTGFESTGYIMNHKNRSIDKERKLTLKDGEKLLNSELSIKNERLAVIPTDYKTENFVYEYHCKAQDGTELLVFLDPDTGEEKDILILLYYDGGVLTK